MNKDDRRHIQVIIDKITDVQDDIGEDRTMDELVESAKAWAETLQPLADDIASFREAEQDKYDNMPEGLQASSRGESMADGIANLEQAHSELELAIYALTKIKAGAPDQDNEENAEAAHISLDDALSYLQDAIS